MKAPDPGDLSQIEDYRRRLRNRRQRELYPAKHRRRRREYPRRIERGEEIICPRCQLPIGPDQFWDLGHDDLNPSMEHPEHRFCNRSASNRTVTSREW